MLLKKIKQRDILINGINLSKLTFKRISGNNFCYKLLKKDQVNNEKCMFKDYCPIKYSCSLVNIPEYMNYSYVPINEIN